MRKRTWCVSRAGGSTVLICARARCTPAQSRARCAPARSTGLASAGLSMVFPRRDCWNSPAATRTIRPCLCPAGTYSRTAKVQSRSPAQPWKTRLEAFTTGSGTEPATGEIHAAPGPVAGPAWSPRTASRATLPQLFVPDTRQTTRWLSNDVRCRRTVDECSRIWSTIRPARVACPCPERAQLVNAVGREGERANAGPARRAWLAPGSRSGRPAVDRVLGEDLTEYASRARGLLVVVAQRV